MHTNRLGGTLVTQPRRRGDCPDSQRNFKNLRKSLSCHYGKNDLKELTANDIEASLIRKNHVESIPKIFKVSDGKVLEFYRNKITVADMEFELLTRKPISCQMPNPFDSDNNIEFLDPYGNPKEKMRPSDLNGIEVVNNYLMKVTESKTMNEVKSKAKMG